MSTAEATRDSTVSSSKQTIKTSAPVTTARRPTQIPITVAASSQLNLHLDRCMSKDAVGCSQSLAYFWGKAQVVMALAESWLPL